MIIDPKQLPQPKLHSYLLGAVAPRPIALASTVDADGNVNLSPFSFFNVFSSNPPIVVFSPARRSRDLTTKHTYENAKGIPEVVINIVNYVMVEQTSLASCEYPRGVNEFVKSGLTPIASEFVKPPRVAESPVAMECRVNQIVELGSGGGAGNLIVCEVLLMHIKDEVLDEMGRIDPYKLDAVARMGQDYYCRAQGDAIFAVPKPNEKLGIGWDQLPVNIRESQVLTGNELARLANIETIPDLAEVTEYAASAEMAAILQLGTKGVHQHASKLLKQGDVQGAWKVLLAGS